MWHFKRNWTKISRAVCGFASLEIIFQLFVYTFEYKVIFQRWFVYNIWFEYIFVNKIWIQFELMEKVGSNLSIKWQYGAAKYICFLYMVPCSIISIYMVSIYGIYIRFLYFIISVNIKLRSNLNWWKKFGAAHGFVSIDNALASKPFSMEWHWCNLHL